MSKKILRITTVPISLKYLLKGQLSFMQENGFEVLAVSAEGKERIDVMQQERVSHIIVPMTRAITPIQDFICLFKLIGVITKFKPDIVHTHTPKAGLLGMVAAFFCSVPLRMHTVAGLPLMEANGLKRKVLIFTEWLTYLFASRVYPNSYGLKKFINENIRVPEKKLKVIGKGSSNGIDTDYFSLRDDVKKMALQIKNLNNIEDSTITFCFVGRVVKDKGIEELLIAFDSLSQSKKVKLILVGPFEDELDPITDASRAIIESNKNVILTGFQNDVRPFIAASDIFVFPSYREGFPNVVMQACCLEVPCIVSDINGCNEIIEQNKTGIIVKPKDVESLYQAMLLLADDGVMRNEFGKKSRAFVKANFDQQYIWQLLLAEYSA
jgi:glycosyltransferase involved in cell wall biosynthesis